MPLANAFRAVEIDQARIAVMTSDAGTEPTYSTSMRIPDIVELGIEPEFRTARAEGDAAVKGVHSKLIALRFTFRCNTVPLDVLAAMTGTTLEISGTTPNQQVIYAPKRTDKPPYFKLAGRWLNVEGVGGDGEGLYVELLKCKLTGWSAAANGEFASIQAQGEAVFTDSSNELFRLVGEETQSDLT